jgi:hypothetical protein
MDDTAYILKNEANLISREDRRLCWRTGQKGTWCDVWEAHGWLGGAGDYGRMHRIEGNEEHPSPF